MAARAVEVSQEIAARGPQRTVDRIVETCLGLLEAPRKAAAPT
jgi:hypothetical protein